MAKGLKIIAKAFRVATESEASERLHVSLCFLLLFLSLQKRDYDKSCAMY